MLITLRNPSGAFVTLSKVGAGIVSVVVPDRDGNLDDVVLGYPDPMSYMHDGPCSGKTVGRFAGRISKGRFVLDGREYELPLNDGKNHLHGGPEGFQNKVWDAYETDGGVEFRYCSKDGEMGYPGMLTVTVRYDWSEENELSITLMAECDAPTIVNLTNHAYFNLDGDGRGDIRNHILHIDSSEYLASDAAFIPTGEIAPVERTPMDFRRPKRVGQDMDSSFPDIVYGRGYNTCWVIDNQGKGELRHVASLYSDRTGRCLKVSTTQPGLMVYTGGWLSDSPVGKCGRKYNDYEGIALECQNFPDAPNHPELPSSVLRPGEQYKHKIIYSFSCH